MAKSQFLFGLLLLAITPLSVADTFERFTRVSCWPEIDMVEIDAISASNLGAYDARILKEKYSIYANSFDTSCHGVRVKLIRNPASATGMCGADPSADIFVWKGGKPLFSQDLFSNSCGSSYIQKITIQQDKVEVCIAGWWKQTDAKKNSTTPPYGGYSIGDRIECRSISLSSAEYPLNLRRLFHDSTLQP